MKKMTVNGASVDLSENPIGINWEYLNLMELDQRYAPFSSLIKLPFTPANNKIMGYGNAVGGRLASVRDLPNVNFWFGPQKVIESGYLKVNSIGKDGFNCNITGQNTLIETLKAYDIETAVSKAAEPFTYTTFANAINSLRIGLDGTKNYGFLLPRTLADPITSSSFTIYDLTDGFTHEVWVSIAALLKGLVDDGKATFKVWETQAFENLTSSYIYPYLQKLYTPAWNYVLKYSTPNWIIEKQTTGQRLINSKLIDRSLFHTLGAATTWDFIKLIGELFCCAILISGTEISFVPLNEITSGKTTDIDFSGKTKNPVKYPNIPGQQYGNYIKYKNTDNLPESYGRHTITAPVNPVDYKDLFTINSILPGLYYNSVAWTIFNTDYSANPELSKSMLFLYDGGELPGYGATTVIYEASPSNYSETSYLKKLERFDFSPFYSSFQLLSLKGIYYEIDIYISPYDFIRMKPYRLLRVNEIGGLYYLNKIANYDPYSGKLAKCQLIKYDYPVMSVDPDSLSFVAAGEAKDLDIISNVIWEVTSYPYWITPDQLTGNGNDTISLAASQNTGGARNGTVIVVIRGYDNDQQQDVTVSQAAAPAPPAQTFTADVSIFNFDYNVYGSANAQVCTLTVTPDQVITESDDLSDWCAVVLDQGANTVTIYPLSENTGEVDRTGIITLSCQDAADIELQITQYYAV